MLTMTLNTIWLSFWDGGAWDTTGFPDVLDDRTRPDYPWRQQQRRTLNQNGPLLGSAGLGLRSKDILARPGLLAECLRSGAGDLSSRA